MKLYFVIAIITCFLSCGNMTSQEINHECFVVASMPDFRIDGVVDIGVIKEYVHQFSTDKETDEIKKSCNGYKCLGFDQGINGLEFFLDKETKKMKRLDAGWNYFEDQDVVLDKIKNSYLPCLPVDQLKAKPGELITINSDNLVETYKFQTNEHGMVMVQYSASIKK